MTAAAFEEDVYLKIIVFGVLTCIDAVMDTGSENAPLYLDCTVAWQMVGMVSDAEIRKWAVEVVADVFEVVTQYTRAMS